MSERSAVTPRDLARLAWSARRYLLSGFVIGAALAIGLAFLVTPIYRAEATVVPLDAAEGSSLLSGLSSQLGELAVLAGINAGSGEFRQQALAYLRSRALAERLITTHKLLPVIFEGSARRRSMTDAVRRLRERLVNISEDRRSGVVTVTVEWKDPERAAFWANELVRLANEELRARTIREAEATRAYLDQQVGKTSILEVRAALYRLIEAQLKSVSVASSRQDFAFRVVDPAVPVDRDDEVWPNKPLLAALGALLGAACGVLIFMYRSRRRAPGSAAMER